MAVTISSTGKEKTFEKEIINIGSNPDCDYVLDVGFNFMLTVQYNAKENKCTIVNTFSNENILFKGKPIGTKLETDKICKLMIEGSSEFIGIKITESAPSASFKTAANIAAEDFTEEDIKGLYGADVNASTRIKIEKKKTDIEKARAAIVKETGSAINALKKRLSLNTASAVFLNIALFLSSLVTAFGVSNYLMGLPIVETKNFLHMPANIKMLFLFTILIFGLSILLKQGVFLLLQNKNNETNVSKTAETFMLGVSSLFIIALYIINLIYYMNPNGNVIFGILISLFFIGIMTTIAISCGYFKYNGQELSKELDKFEYREDFEEVMTAYGQWIERYINSLGKNKLQNIKDKLFSLQLKSAGELIIGLLTAPFLAYGVSNTLAMCFPEAAGWVRISGLRFSPVFLVLATFLIIFAFFAFVNAFYSVRKIQGSEVIKQDGFSNYLSHGVDIAGLQGVRKMNTEKTRSLVIGLVIIFIEFSMNTSYFMTEIGGDFQGIFLSVIAALVPTALLIAETYMLSQTKFDIYASEELLAKLD